VVKIRSAVENYSGNPFFLSLGRYSLPHVTGRVYVERLACLLAKLFVQRGRLHQRDTLGVVDNLSEYVPVGPENGQPVTFSVGGYLVSDPTASLISGGQFICISHLLILTN
jgi:hypothetical protein